MAEAEHRLAAILAADVVGYSRLMAADDQGTVTALDQARCVFRDAVSAEKGRIVDTSGDSILAVFTTATGAVRAALAAQTEINETAETLPEDRRMLFRIGVTLGEVIEKADGTVYGDGVNIAARLEAAGDPGGITLSGTAYDHVHNRIGVGYTNLGALEVKNIPEPVRAYRIDGLGAPPPAQQTAQQSAGLPSIAVLPFTNLSGDPDQDYVVDGLTENLITELSQYRTLSVVARASVLAYKGQAVDIRKVGANLGAGYIVEGTVQIAPKSERVRISAQLVDAATGTHLWADRFDRTLDDIFELQDDITDRITVALDVTVLEGDMSHERRASTKSAEAYRIWKRGNELFETKERESNVKAKKLMEQAISLDPSFALAYANYGYCHLRDVDFGWGPSKEASLRQARVMADKALAIDPNDVTAHMLMSSIHRLNGDHELAIQSGRKAAELAPSNADAIGVYATKLISVGKADDGIAVMTRAIGLAPTTPHWMRAWLGYGYRRVKKLDDALKQFETAYEVNQSDAEVLIGLTATCSALGRHERAHEIAAQLVRVDPTFRVDGLIPSLLVIADKAEIEAIKQDLRNAGLR